MTLFVPHAMVPPFRIEVDVMISYGRCAGHAGYTCPTTLFPGEICYQRSEPESSAAATLCNACGERAVSELHTTVRKHLASMAGVGDGPICSCPPITTKGNVSTITIDPACQAHGTPK